MELWSTKKIFDHKNDRRLHKHSLNATHESLDKFIINPWFVTGFTDAEGCFTINITRKNGSKQGAPQRS